MIIRQGTLLMLYVTIVVSQTLAQMILIVQFNSVKLYY